MHGGRGRAAGDGPLRPARGADGRGLVAGAAVAGTVSRAWLAGWAVVVVLLVLGTALGLGDLGRGGRLVAAAALGLGAGELLHRRARARLGGVTGDVMGAAGEVTTAGTLLAAVLLLG